MADVEREMAMEGALLMGADGAVYFIPSQYLEAFRVPDEGANEARESLNPEVVGHQLPMGTEAGGMKILTAVQGRLGYLPQAGPTTIPGFVDFGLRRE